MSANLSRERLAEAIMPHVWPGKHYAAADAVLAMTDEAFGDLHAALKGVVGEPDDPKVGWRSAHPKPSTADHFRCEYCQAEDLDCVAMVHAEGCPVPAAFAALRKAESSPT